MRGEKVVSSVGRVGRKPLPNLGSVIMIKKPIALGLTALLLAYVLPSRADDLMQVYRQAVTNDAKFRKAQADWLTARENLPLARSGNGTPGSGLFPNLDLSGELDRTYQKQNSGPVTSDGYFNGNSYGLVLTQPIFNYQTWKMISGAQYSVKAAAATYISAEQDLLFRVSQAYFNVLRAYDKLQYTVAQKKSFLRQLITAQQKFHVGLIAITGVYDAQASYDGSVAQEIQDRNNLENQIENLRAITGRGYQYLTGLRQSIPLIVPSPRSIERWVGIADQQNYAIKSALYTMLAERENVKAKRAGAYPTLTGTASYNVLTTGVIPGIGQAVQTNSNLASFTTKTVSGSLNLDFPVYQGGYVIASTRQAEYKYLSASDQLDFTHRDVVRQTRESYLGVESGISQIQADRQAILSAKNKLEATQAGYEVGTRTMVDVLNAVTTLYQAQQKWADDRYNYVISIITLKQQAGTLCPEDLDQINRWLADAIDLTFKTPIKINSTPITVMRDEKSLDEHADEAGAISRAKPPKGGQPQPHYQGAIKTNRHLVANPKAVIAENQEAQSEHYAIQLFAAHDPLLAKQFIDQQSNKNELCVISADNPVWYKVVYGNFDSQEKAISELQHLPANLKVHKPWVVRVAEHPKSLTIPVPDKTNLNLPEPSSDTINPVSRAADSVNHQ